MARGLRMRGKAVSGRMCARGRCRLRAMHARVPLGYPVLATTAATALLKRFLFIFLASGTIVSRLASRLGT